MSEKFRAAAQRENRTFTQTAARMSGRIHTLRTNRPFAAFAPRAGFEGLNEAGVFQLVISIFGGPQKSISPVQGDGGVLRPCAFRALPALKHGSAQVSRWGVCHDALWI
jgi:hypothetical protein